MPKNERQQMTHSPEIKTLLNSVATASVNEAAEWEKTYGDLQSTYNPDFDDSDSDGPWVKTAQEEKYHGLCDSTKTLFAVVGARLQVLGYPAFDATISGVAQDIDHYELDALMEAEFGDDIRTDSELGTFFNYTTSAKAEEVRAFAEKVSGEGSSFRVTDSDSWWIKGVANCGDARNLLKEINQERLIYLDSVL